MPAPAGFSVMKSSFRRPTLESMPTDTKAGCLYPNNARAIREARAKGFDNALVCDMLGNVAETATSNIFLAKDGVVRTPAANGTFLNGITRQRVIGLLRGAGVDGRGGDAALRGFRRARTRSSQRATTRRSCRSIRIDDRDLQPGPFFRKARELYWAFAHEQGGRKPPERSSSARCADSGSLIQHEESCGGPSNCCRPVVARPSPGERRGA